jgi:excisionase family DNA binding protein
MTDPIPPWLSVVEFARLLRVSKWSVYDAVNAKQIRAIRVGRSVRIPVTELDRMAAGE